MDSGAWWAMVHRVAKSWTRLEWLSMHTCQSQENQATKRRTEPLFARFPLASQFPMSVAVCSAALVVPWIIPSTLHKFLFLFKSTLNGFLSLIPNKYGINKYVQKTVARDFQNAHGDEKWHIILFLLYVFLYLQFSKGSNIISIIKNDKEHYKRRKYLFINKSLGFPLTIERASLQNMLLKYSQM